MDYVYNYFLIFHRDCEGLGHFCFIVENENVAIQFCKDFPEYYYMPRETIVDSKESE